MDFDKNRAAKSYFIIKKFCVVAYFLPSGLRLCCPQVLCILKDLLWFSCRDRTHSTRTSGPKNNLLLLVREHWPPWNRHTPSDHVWCEIPGQISREAPRLQWEGGIHTFLLLGAPESHTGCRSPAGEPPQPSWWLTGESMCLCSVCLYMLRLCQLLVVFCHQSQQYWCW